MKQFIELAEKTCSSLNIDLTSSKRKRKKTCVPLALCDCLMDTYLTAASDASTVDGTDISQAVKVDFYYPVLDVLAQALNSRFNAECLTVVKHIPAILKCTDSFDAAVVELSKLARLDGDKCIAEGKLLICYSAMKSTSHQRTLLACRV